MWNDLYRDVVGQGIAFPLQFDARGQLALANGFNDIDQSISIILGTIPGERVMRPEFGCRAWELLFDPIGSAMVGQMRAYVEEALVQWEPRIDLAAIEVYKDDDHEGGVLVEIQYVVKATSDERSIVYPFFIQPEEE